LNYYIIPNIDIGSICDKGLNNIVLVLLHSIK
jgi:hypothetical protein